MVFKKVSQKKILKQPHPVFKHILSRTQYTQNPAWGEQVWQEVGMTNPQPLALLWTLDCSEHGTQFKNHFCGPPPGGERQGQDHREWHHTHVQLMGVQWYQPGSDKSRDKKVNRAGIFQVLMNINPRSNMRWEVHIYCPLMVLILRGLLRMWAPSPCLCAFQLKHWLRNLTPKMQLSAFLHLLLFQSNPLKILYITNRYTPVFPSFPTSSQQKQRS